MKVISLAICLAFSLLTFSQNPNTRVEIKSPEEDLSKTDTSSWEFKWKRYIDLGSLKIAEKALLRDSTKIIFGVVVEFSINEDASLKDLKITCLPPNKFIEDECRKMVVNAPKKTPVYRNDKYVRPHIVQPIEIKINGKPQ
jgi:hypothetical protein